MKRLQLLLFFGNWLLGMSSPPDLDPHGINVCKPDSDTKELVCCPGWKQEGRACAAAICEGDDACKTDEVCIRPGVCRCKPGFFGASCNSRCPNQYWGSDCKQSCACYPFGKCDPVTGECTCNTNRWGPMCQSPCLCSPHGTCNPLTGSCQCDLGWWAPYCNKPCHCNLQTSRCNPATGHCICDIGWWGQRCSVKCNCNRSPCLQINGQCKCQEGWWGGLCERQCDCLHGKCSSQRGECDCDVGFQGRSCTDPCTAGTYGPKCKLRCGRCKENQACSPVDGFCPTCDLGWNGTRCDQPCLPGFYGENCEQKCPRCRGEEVCNGETGTCGNCDPGKMGPRCESTCPAGSYGERCQFMCPDCIHGRCDPVTGECICETGYWQYSCNETCPHDLFGPNCSSTCECNGGPCSPLSGTCQWTSSQKGGIIAGVLVPVLLLVICYCCCCGNNQSEPKDRVPNGEGGSLARMKYNFQGALANVSSVLPCCSVGSSKLSWVTVSHHDTELPFNHSFIESPSTGWLSENSFSSFDSDEGDPVYCVPPMEGMSVADMDGFQEISSKCNVFQEALTFNSEDVCQPFSIPRTSSIAKAKRPSVSFAEGTKFETRRLSTTETPNLARKPKIALSLPKLPSLQSQPIAGEALQGCEQTNEFYETVSPTQEPEEHPKLQRTTPGGRRRTMSNAQKIALKADMLEVGLRENIYEVKRKNHNISTVYVSIGPPRKPYKPRIKSEGNVDGAVQAVLKRLGSFQRGKQDNKHESNPRNNGEGIPKPTRKSLLQLPTSKTSQSKISHEEGLQITSKHPDSLVVSSNATFEDNPAKKPLIPTSSILKKIVSKAEEGTEWLGSCDKLENTYSNLPGPGKLWEQTNNAEHIYPSTECREDSEPKYENVSITNCFVNELDASCMYEDAQMNGDCSDT